jgi:L-amino acid N-acyltransferase YncA
MRIERCTRADFLEILKDQEAFWGSDRALPVHHPMLLEEFGDTAFVVRDGPTLCGYLFGFFAQTGAYFYIHLVAVRNAYKGHGIGTALYAHVERLAREAGVASIKAITTPSNAGSIAFHRALGFALVGDAEQNGVRYMPNYAGKECDRVVMVKSLRSGSA